MEVIFQHQLLQQRRKEKQLTQETLAELCNCTPRYLRDLESGRKNNPSAALVRQIAFVLELSSEELLLVHDQDPGDLLLSNLLFYLG